MRIEILLMFWGAVGALPLQNNSFVRSLMASCRTLRMDTSDSGTRRKISEHFSYTGGYTENTCLVLRPGCYEKRADGTAWWRLTGEAIPASQHLIIRDELYWCPALAKGRPAFAPWRYALFVVVSVVVVGGAVLLVYVALTSPINLISKRLLEPYTSPCLQHRSIF